MKAVTTAQMHALDQRTMAAVTPGPVLMERAGVAIARRVWKQIASQPNRAVLLLAGKGNNGGDAVAAARHLASLGAQPTLALVGKQDNLPDLPMLRQPTTEQLRALSPAVIVDGLLGTGLQGDVREPFDAAIRFINDSRVPVIAIDVPSGLDADTGKPHGICVCADVTLTMGLPKIGLLRPAATSFVGTIEVADIGFPPEFVAEIPSDIDLLTANDVRPLLPRLNRSAHKGDNGHLLILAGSEGYSGAPVLCAHAAARAGAGLVTLAVPRDIYPIVAGNCPPEIMPRALDQLGSLADYDAVALGPGLGHTEEIQRLIFQWISDCPRPLVVDADGLNALARNISLLNTVTTPLVLTPHPGEMARLTGKAVNEVQTNRWEIARRFAEEHRVVLTLKGPGTVVTDATGHLWINSTGNPGMAKGGMGDTLTGIIGALLAQGLKPFEAARAGVFLHGLAGDIACKRHGERAMSATDLIGSFSRAFQRLDRPFCSPV